MGRAFGRIDHLAQDRGPTASARARLLNMGTSFTRTARLDGAQQRSAKKTPAWCAADILVRPNLMIWNSAVHCTQVDPDTVMVRCAAPWLSYLFGCLDTAGRFSAKGERAPSFGSGSKEYTRRSSEPEPAPMAVRLRATSSRLHCADR
jgi:hypothetical protein